MSTFAPAPARLPRHRVPGHLNALGFLAGGAAGAVAYLLVPSLALAVLACVDTWYLVSAGVRDVLTQPHPRLRAAYVALVPLSAAAAAAAAYLALDDLVAAALIGLAAGPAAQWVLARAFLRQVVRDKDEELRRRLGLL